MTTYTEPPHSYRAADIANCILDIGRNGAAELPAALEIVQGLVDRITELEKVVQYFAGQAEMARRLEDVLVAQQDVPRGDLPAMVGSWVQSAQGIVMSTDPAPYVAALDAYGRARMAAEHDARVTRLLHKRAAERIGETTY